jgi:hypothetical protein
MSQKPREIQGSVETEDYGADIKKCAEDCLLEFFEDKRLPNGQPIPHGFLLSDFSVKTVMRSQFDDRCFNFLHSECLPLIPKHPGYDEPTVPWTVHCLLLLIKQMCSRGVPKEFQPGLLLLYFKFCFGVKILPPPLL